MTNERKRAKALEELRSAPNSVLESFAGFLEETYYGWHDARTLAVRELAQEIRQLKGKVDDQPE